MYVLVAIWAREDSLSAFRRRMIAGILAITLFAVVTIAEKAPLLAQGSVELQPVLLQMIRDDAIHEELHLEPPQIESIIAFLPQVDGRWFHCRNDPFDQRIAETDKLTKQLQQAVNGILDTDQLKRLRQLERQALGTRMGLRDDLANELKLNDGQRSKLLEAAQQTVDKAKVISEQLKDGSMDQVQANRQITQLQNDERRAMVKAMTKNQRARLSELTGPAFDFGNVKRMYPIPPELETQGVQWVQGGPLELKQQQGKVVAVHFYAFQCINCVRNLPHYQAWHKDYADQGLVVIGIQTPETPSERSFDRVSAAAKEKGIQYPVMLDQASENWNAWHNTMWPTVYLIDKKGFLRRWWQGEMNWKGTLGEQQMRETIEMLLAE